ncbi:ENTH domain-containing protein [Psidium guajava]|nr:ENTH domain-containing protein [Psidium guajava]
MENLLLGQVKKQASSFLQDKYKAARLALTDVTQAELLAEDVTNNDPSSPDARSMTQIAEASYDIDDYLRVADVLHKRLQNIDWKQWRQFYKTLILLEFLLTHGPEEFAEEFEGDVAIIEELGSFQHVDEKGFNWGVNMHKKAEQILKLLGDRETLKEARLKALKITKEIQGFGCYTSSPSSESSCSISETLRTSSFGSGSNRSHQWDHHATKERGSLLNPEDHHPEQKNSLVSGICSKLAALSPRKAKGTERIAFRSLSDAGKAMRKNFERQFSIGY